MIKPNFKKRNHSYRYFFSLVYHKSSDMPKDNPEESMVNQDNKCDYF